MVLIARVFINLLNNVVKTLFFWRTCKAHLKSLRAHAVQISMRLFLVESLIKHTYPLSRMRWNMNKYIKIPESFFQVIYFFLGRGAIVRWTLLLFLAISVLLFWRVFSSQITTWMAENKCTSDTNVKSHVKFHAFSLSGHIEIKNVFKGTQIKMLAYFNKYRSHRYNILIQYKSRAIAS